MSKLTHGAAYEQFLLVYARRKAAQVRADAASLTTYIQQIQELPEWDTEAESVVADARLKLSEALLAVTLADNEFKRRRIAFLGLEAAE